MIVISEFIDPEGLEILEQAGFDLHYDPELWQNRDALGQKLADADALVVRNQTQVDAALLQHAPKLRVVGRLGVGLENIDLEAAKARNVEVVWPRGANAVAVAEYVFAAMFQLSRNLSTANADVAQGGWKRREFGGFELWNKTLGLVGVGEVGFRVARRARVFGMRVLASDPAREPSEALVEEEGFHLVDLETVFTKSDFISLHAPLTPSTRHLIDRSRLSRMHQGAYLINTARGGLVDPDALAEALKSGVLGGAVLDVVDQEPLPPDHVLRGVPNLWITPHVAGLTREAQQRVTERVAQGVIQALRGKSNPAHGLPR